jgi:glycosyltransferase involved in cell wall biosynthesis
MNAQPVETRVLHVLGPLRPSGMERMLVSAARHFRDENIVNIVLGQGDDHPFCKELEAAGYGVRIVRSVGRSWRDVRQLRRIVRQEAIEVIHIHTEANYLRTAFACRFALGTRGTMVRTIHSIFDATGVWRTKRFLQSLVADRLMSSVIAPSPDVADNERKIGRHPKVIYNWVDDRLFEIRDARDNAEMPINEVPLGLIVGNCSPVKHHELALRALESSTHRIIHLGDERYASEEELAILERLDIDGRVVGRGSRAPDDALRQSDYFMMPSRREGMSVALAEALVAGVPSLVNDAPGLRWAQGMDGVHMLPEDELAWFNAVADWQAEVSRIRPLSIDFSAYRGAGEYADVYRAITVRTLAATRVGPKPSEMRGEG